MAGMTQKRALKALFSLWSLELEVQKHIIKKHVFQIWSI